MVAYDRQTYNAPNPMARLAHRARYGNADRLIAKYLKPDGVMLDYGCGDGRMLRRVREFAPAADLIGYEPLMQGEGEGYRRFTHEEDARGCRYDLVTAFEVLEHLLPEDIGKFVTLTKDTIKADGRVIISVPIMLGPVLIPKVINAQFIRKSAWKYSFSELVRGAIFLKPVPRYHGS
ncbi:Methyltransferase type 11 [Parvibaculum lavamentivorans DS-1]|uniref:Methyltransferase type 11 n=1 Tax=Parvibaculum lavamentivorans (strain DS-1 / DSM 13023 / NCIMB 13966) TaxID=402881 RepID=A7HUF2_PARL1|nr:methyltransferase domain-containing protein [Parvibaculum lavamentivorans]ABS63535.1 Methyltransferase type 11 [Parvibaculum lavamentivorans DS-1]